MGAGRGQKLQARRENVAPAAGPLTKRGLARTDELPSKERREWSERKIARGPEASTTLDMCGALHRAPPVVAPGIASSKRHRIAGLVPGWRRVLLLTRPAGNREWIGQGSGLPVDGSSFPFQVPYAMIGRTLTGLLTGLLLGGVIAAGLVFGLGWASLPFWLMAVAMALTGTLIGLVAGKPVWAEGARIEAGLKAGVGAVLAVVSLWLLNRYTGLTNAAPLPFGHAKHVVGQVSVLAFPMIAAALTTLFEIDNTPETEEAKAIREKAAAHADALPAGKIRVDTREDLAEKQTAKESRKIVDDEFGDDELLDDDRELLAMLDAKEKKRK